MDFKIPIMHLLKNSRNLQFWIQRLSTLFLHPVFKKQAKRSLASDIFIDFKFIILWSFSNWFALLSEIKLMFQAKIRACSSQMQIYFDEF